MTLNFGPEVMRALILEMRGIRERPSHFQRRRISGNRCLWSILKLLRRPDPWYLNLWRVPTFRCFEGERLLRESPLWINRINSVERPLWRATHVEVVPCHEDEIVRVCQNTGHVLEEQHSRDIGWLLNLSISP